MKLAILTVTRNDACGLEKTIKSVVQQDLACFVHYIQDASSHDYSQSYLEYTKRYISSGGQVFYSRGRDGGIYDAMNKMCKKVREEYILFLNSGDCFHDGSVVRRIITTLTSLRRSDHVIFPWVYEHSGTRVFRSPLPSRLILSQMTFCHQACISKAARLVGEPFRTDYSILADWDFFCREKISGAHFSELTAAQLQPIVIFDAMGLSSTRYLLMFVEAIKISFAHRLFGYQGFRLTRNLCKLFFLIPFSSLFKFKTFFLVKRHIARILDSRCYCKYEAPTAPATSWPSESP